MASPARPAILILDGSVLCSPWMDQEALSDLASAIDTARGWFPLWRLRVEPEHATDAMKRSDWALGGERLVIQDERGQALLRRVLWLLDGWSADLVAPCVVWLITDRLKPIGTKVERDLREKINALLKARGADCAIRILPAPDHKAVEGDDLVEVFAQFAQKA